MARAMREGPCLALDACLPTMAEAVDALSDLALSKVRERMERIGIGADAQLAPLCGQAAGVSAYLALRGAALEESRVHVMEQGLVPDYFSSLAALELGRLLAGGEAGNKARLLFTGREVLFTALVGGRIQMRRFASAADLEISAALARYAAAGSGSLTMDGVLSEDSDAHSLQAGTTGRGFEDTRCEDSGKALARMLDAAAELASSGGPLAIFRPKGAAGLNAGLRWLPPLALALAILCAAPALWIPQALEQRKAALDEAAKEAKALSIGRERAGENSALLDSLASAEALRGELREQLLRRQAAFDTLAGLDGHLEGLPGLAIDRLRIGGSGDSIAIQGRCPLNSRASIRLLVDSLERDGLRITRDIALDEREGFISFTLGMERRK